MIDALPLAKEIPVEEIEIGDWITLVSTETVDGVKSVKERKLVIVESFSVLETFPAQLEVTGPSNAGGLSRDYATETTVRCLGDNLQIMLIGRDSVVIGF